MSIYYTDESAKYIFSLEEGNAGYYCACNEAIINGEKKLLHNEVSFNFTLVNGDIKVYSGYHIGTEDFDFSVEDGDDCNAYVEQYHPGLLKQVKEALDEGNILL